MQEVFAEVKSILNIALAILLFFIDLYYIPYYIPFNSATWGSKVHTNHNFLVLLLLLLLDALLEFVRE
jgi:hypothetical protein